MKTDQVLAQAPPGRIPHCGTPEPPLSTIPLASLLLDALWCGHIPPDHLFLPVLAQPKQARELLMRPVSLKLLSLSLVRNVDASVQSLGLQQIFSLCQGLG
ncbi:hypothetical protein NDU88_003053 [Pleurodeles waltl]|uniref:Uncharacterized protein n=1 Tax=Pleurodeles waltl TaxID=8319 RepID=A0AAV7PA70_PLEWA|nr:hypothetical protein NDU88_003053 [Pleurodeles waltl]